MDNSSYSHADRNLLLGILALQVDFITRDELTAATSAWLQNKSRSLDEILLEQGVLKDSELQLLLPLVEQHIANHEGDPARSLAALSGLGSVAEDLRRLGDEQIDATLSLAGQDRGESSLEPTMVHESSTGSATGRSGKTSASKRFRILRPHAKGGLGEVSVAKDVELNRDVALKEIQSRFADDEASRSRFLLEAEVTGGLEHPGIVPVYGLGRYDDGRPFYAMRFIRGDSLQEAADRFHGKGNAAADHVDFSSVEFRKLLGRFVDVCQAIEYAHSRGVLHRDLKPGNIMLGKYGETLVVDWGLAKTREGDDLENASGEAPLQPASASGSAPTVMGSAIGTPAFMPPEQAAGRLDELGQASDVYSLGATLYYMLTGRAPFRGKDVVAVLKDVQAGKFPAPRSIQANAPKALEAVCCKAMALNVSQRYRSPLELADDVERYLADEAVTAHAEPFIVKTRRWVRKHQTLAASTAAVVLVSAIGLGVFSTIVSGKNAQLNEANVALDRKNEQLDAKNVELTNANAAELAARALAESNEQAARKQSQLAMATLASVVNDIDSGLRTVAGGGQVRQRLLKTSLEKLESVATPFVAQTTVDRNTQKALGKMGDVILKLTPGNEVVGGMPQSRPLSESRQSGVRLARSFFERALVIAQQLAKADPDDSELQQMLMISHRRMGLVSDRMGQMKDAFGFYSRAVEIGDNLLEATPNDVGVKQNLCTVVTVLGDAQFMMGQHGKAIQQYHRSLEISQELAVAEPNSRSIQGELAQAYSRVGMVNHLSLGKLEEAIDYYTKSKRIRERLLASDPTNTAYQRLLAHSLLTLGNACRRANRFVDALTFLGQMLEISKARALADPSDSDAQVDLAIALRTVGKLKVEQRQLQTAIELYEEALKIDEKLTADDPNDTHAQHAEGQTHHHLGEAQLKARRPDLAIEHLTKSVTILKTMLTTDSANEELRRDVTATYKLLEEARGAAQVQVAFGDWERLMEQPPRERIVLLYGRGFTMAESGKVKEAVQAANALRDIADGARHANLYSAACIYGDCVRILNPVAGLSEEQKTLRKQLIADSIAALRRSVEAGWYKMDVLRANPSLAPARQLPEFEEVLKLDLPEKRRAAMQTDIDEVELDIAEFDKQIEEDPDDPSTYFQRAISYQLLRDWEHCAADHQRAAELRGRTTNRVALLRVATLFILAGEPEKYKAACEQIAQVFHNTLIPPEADITCKSQSLLPGVFDPALAPTSLIEEAIDKKSPDWFPPWGASTLALHAYRQGKWEDALSWVSKIDKQSWDGKPWAIGLAVRAMAEFRLGKVDEAKSTLKEAADAIPADLRTLQADEARGEIVPPLETTGIDWLIAEILRREAEATLNGKTTEEYINSWKATASARE